jgi:hypothetical protein
MVKIVELQVTLDGYTAEVRCKGVSAAQPPHTCRQTASQFSSPSNPLYLQALFELVYGGNGEFLRHFHKTVNQDPSELPEALCLRPSPQAAALAKPALMQPPSSSVMLA